MQQRRARLAKASLALRCFTNLADEASVAREEIGLDSEALEHGHEEVAERCVLVGVLVGQWEAHGSG